MYCPRNLFLSLSGETTLRTPSLFIRVGKRFRINSFWWSESLWELITSNQRVTRVLTLFTFWPPGPLLREAVNFSSPKGTAKVSVIITIFVKKESRHLVWCVLLDKEFWFFVRLFTIPVQGIQNDIGIFRIAVKVGKAHDLGSFTLISGRGMHMATEYIFRAE